MQYPRRLEDGRSAVKQSLPFLCLPPSQILALLAIWTLGAPLSPPLPSLVHRRVLQQFGCCVCVDRGPPCHPALRQLAGWRNPNWASLQHPNSSMLRQAARSLWRSGASRSICSSSAVLQETSEESKQVRKFAGRAAPQRRRQPRASGG